MKYDKFFTRPNRVCVSFLLPKVLPPVGQKSCQRGRLEVEVSRGLGLKAKKGRAEGDHHIGATNQEKGLWHSRMGDHGRKSLSTAGGTSGHKKGAEMDEGRMAGRVERPWKRKVPLLGLVLPVTCSALGFQNRFITSSSFLPSIHSLSHLSSLCLMSRQTWRSMLDPAGNVPDYSKNLHSLKKINKSKYVLHKNCWSYFKNLILCLTIAIAQRRRTGSWMVY